MSATSASGASPSSVKAPKTRCCSILGVVRGDEQVIEQRHVFVGGDHVQQVAVAISIDRSIQRLAITKGGDDRTRGAAATG
jgi:hypothetical protein